METMYLLVDANSTLVFGNQLNNICIKWYLLKLPDGVYWLLKINKANKNLVIDVLFNQIKDFLKNAAEYKNINLHNEALALVKKHALGLIKPNYREISEDFAQTLISDIENQ